MRSAELRYQGQEHTVNVALAGQSLAASDIARFAEAFHVAHMAQYGHRMEDPVELVTIRVSALGLLPRPKLPVLTPGTGKSQEARKGTRPVYQSVRGEYIDHAVYERGRLLYGDSVVGPAIIEEPSSTTILHAGEVMTVGRYGELVIEIGRS
jgi:N-methylhydantoinase A